MSQPDIVSSDPLPIGENPVLQGIFAPVDVELTAHDLPIEGTIPSQLDGILLRDGPNLIAPGPGHHWFLGDGMVHGITIQNGAAISYRNR